MGAGGPGDSQPFVMGRAVLPPAQDPGGPWRGQGVTLYGAFRSVGAPPSATLWLRNSCTARLYKYSLYCVTGFTVNWFQLY